MATEASIARSLKAIFKTAKSMGMEPHVWIDPDGGVHVVKDDGLTGRRDPSPVTEENPWDAYARS